MREKGAAMGSKRFDRTRFWTLFFSKDINKGQKADGCMLRVYISIIRKNGDTLIARNRRYASTVGVKTHVPNCILVTFIDLDTLA